MRDSFNMVKRKKLFKVELEHYGKINVNREMPEMVVNFYNYLKVMSY